LAAPVFAPYTMNRPGVVSFIGEPIVDSLCIIGFPVATLYAKSSPGGVVNGPTDTDFFIRILDVYPDGRELFVVEGCVNARARNYVRNLVEHPDWDNTIPYSNDDTPFTNIEIGKIYEYKFKMLPIAYVWGAGHKIKILISSSNYTRYQVNPNLPIEPGDFFRRKPGDGRTYTFEGAVMEPRIAVQRIAFSDIYPTNVKLPVFTPGFISGNEETNPARAGEKLLDALVYPNPASDNISIYMNRNGSFEISLFNTLGQVMLNTEFENDINIEVSDLEKGLYFLEISAKDGSASGGKELKGSNRIIRKISVM
ncbi:MAG: T9SS type A sorting domain-containing protein, partial [Bacteroidetes bacterium]|nr:T9SS type A sorting domain-containing protein [Bacteroidota bacterium]